MNPPEIQTHRQVADRLIDEAQGHVAGFFRGQLGVASAIVEELLLAITTGVTPRLDDTSGTQNRVVVIALGKGRAARGIQFIKRRRAEAFAVGTTDHQLLERLVAEGVFRVGGAAEVAVFVVTNGGGQLQAVQHGDVQFGVFRLDAPVTFDTACGIGAQTADVVDVSFVRLMHFLFAVFAT